MEAAGRERERTGSWKDAGPADRDTCAHQHAELQPRRQLRLDAGLLDLLVVLVVPSASAAAAAAVASPPVVVARHRLNPSPPSALAEEKRI